jgi:hypothetical protein
MVAFSLQERRSAAVTSNNQPAQQETIAPSFWKFLTRRMGKNEALCPGGTTPLFEHFLLTKVNRASILK